MILGLGTDIVDNRRIALAFERHGERFLNHICTEAEAQTCLARADRSAHLSGLFAAKEACAKALGTGIRRGVHWKDMGVVNLPTGQPTMKLTGGAADRLAQITPAGHEARVHLTITDEFPLAYAQVIIEATPSPAS